MFRLVVPALMLVSICGTATSTAQIVADGGFELGRPNAEWAESSTNFGSPICSVQLCTGFFGEPFEGGWWAWFGGSPQQEIGSVSQEVIIPAGSATLSFWLNITLAGGNGVDFLTASIDGVELFTALESDVGSYNPWTEVSIDISAFADGGTHLLSFDSTTTGPQMTNFFLDAVEITSQAGPTPGDMDEDGDVDAFDLAQLLGSWGSYEPCPPYILADVDQDCNVGAFDLAQLLGNWGP